MKIPPNNPDELTLMMPDDGRYSYQAAPIVHPLSCCAALPTNIQEAEATATYLWVLDGSDVPHALERGDWGILRASGALKHSNLTGGNPAYLGGEAWFIDPATMAINFDSGRYGIWDHSEAPIAEAFVEALIDDGYRVATPEPPLEGKNPYLRYIYGNPVFREKKRE
jgi:hypothetical protein